MALLSKTILETVLYKKYPTVPHERELLKEGTEVKFVKLHLHYLLTDLSDICGYCVLDAVHVLEI